MTDAVPAADAHPGPEPSPEEPGPLAPPPPGPTVPEPPAPPSQPQPVPPEVPGPPDVPAPPSGGTATSGPTSHPAASGLRTLPHTGDTQVDAALEDLMTVRSRPLEEQVEVYVGAHRKLQDRLADLDG
jgi:hypothetical protein